MYCLPIIAASTDVFLEGCAANEVLIVTPIPICSVDPYIGMIPR